MLGTFSCAYWPLVHFFWKNGYLGLPIFWLFFFFCHWVVWAVYTFWKLQIFLQVFSPSPQVRYIQLPVSMGVSTLTSTYILFHSVFMSSFQLMPLGALLSHPYHLFIPVLSPESQSLAVELSLWLWNVSPLWSLHALLQSFVYLEGPPVRLSCVFNFPFWWEMGENIEMVLLIEERELGCWRVKAEQRVGWCFQQQKEDVARDGASEDRKGRGRCWTARGKSSFFWEVPHLIRWQFHVVDWYQNFPLGFSYLCLVQQSIHSLRWKVRPLECKCE